MNLYGKAQETAGKVLAAFANPNALPAALAPIVINRKDDAPCRQWSWNNQLLTALAGTADARGYRQWESAARHVKKGAKAFYILIPCMKRVGENEDGEPIHACYGFKAAPVFRFEDTDSEPLAVDERYENWIQSLPLRDVAESWGLSIETYNGKSGKAHGKYLGRGIGVEAEGIAIALGVENLATWLHELMHAADHKLGNLVERGQHWRSEVVAEFGGAILAECLGYEREADLGGAYEYVRAYAETAGKCPENAALECLDRICKAVALILEAGESLAEPESGACINCGNPNPDAYDARGNAICSEPCEVA